MFGPGCVCELDVEHLVDGPRRRWRTVLPGGQHMEAVEAQPECAGWSTRWTMRQASSCVRSRPHGTASYASRRPRCSARSASACSCSAARSSSSSPAAVLDEQHTSTLAPSSASRSNFRSARRRLAANRSGGNRLDVERLIDLDRQAEARGLLGQPAGRPRRHDEVVLEQLHAGEAGSGGGAQLVLERAGEAHGRDGQPRDRMFIESVATCSTVSPGE